MNAETLIEPVTTVAEKKLRLFSLYVDFAAAVRARWATNHVTQLAGGQWKASTEMWNLDSLTTSEPIRKMIVRDAADADVLIVAASSLDRRETELVWWLDEVAAVKTARPAAGLFIGLLGDDLDQAGELDWTIKQFLRCAGALDRDFIWRWMEREAMDSDEWLADSVAALLARKQPATDTIFWPGAVAVAV